MSTADTNSGPHLTPLSDGQWLLTHDFTVELPVIGELTIPAGYITNGASIPPMFGLLWYFIGTPMESEFVGPALVHDYFCDDAEQNSSYSTRVMGDGVFFKLLSDAHEIPYWKRAAMYLAVRYWGRATFWLRGDFE